MSGVWGVSPDEKIFTPTDERGFLPYTPHPTPPFKSGVESWGFMKFPHFPYPLSVPRSAVPAFAKMVRSSRAGGQEFVKRFQPYRDY
jgi:hypothetical protein